MALPVESWHSEVRALVDLGLTLVQARVYLTLVRFGASKTLAISKISEVAQPDVYRALSKLQELGLVEKMIEVPFQYRAIPADLGITILLETKKEQYEKVRTGAQKLLDTVKTIKPDNANQPIRSQFVMIPEGRAVVERINSAIAHSQINIDLFLSWKRFSRGIASTHAESMESAWAKNVKIRFIIESPLESKTAKQLIQFCREKPFTQIKFIPDYPKMVFGICDKKEVFIIVDPKADLLGSPALWSNNPALIALAWNCFETLWPTAIESNFKIPRKPKK
jgi:sugar-specific transcriptional regulator TrmB